MRWIAWGSRVVDKEKEDYVVGELDCENNISSALVLARDRYGFRIVDHVQSRLSYEIDLLTAQDKVLVRYHPRRSPIA